MATACYEPQYLPASYKGVSFLVEEVSSAYGRRGAVGEFPFGEDTAYADLGRKAQIHEVTGRLQENNHVEQAAALIAACESPQPGLLVHPTRGVLNVACVELKVTDAPETAQGITTFTAKFVEAQTPTLGIRITGTLFGVTMTASISIAATAFMSLFVPSAVPPQHEATVWAAGRNRLKFIGNEYVAATVAKSKNRRRNSIVHDINDVASGGILASALRQDVYAGGRLVDPAVVSLASAITRSMDAIAAETSGASRYAAFRRIANDAARESAISGIAGVAENAVYSLVRSAAAMHMARALLEEDTSGVDLVAGAQAVDAILSDELLFAKQTAQNAYLVELSNIRYNAVTSITQRALAAPGTVHYNSGGLSGLVAAYEIHGDAKRVREVTASSIVGRFGFLRDVIATV